MIPDFNLSKRQPATAVILLVVLLVAACGPVQSTAPSPSAAPTTAPTAALQPTTLPSATPQPRATPYAQEPAAGICAEPAGEVVTVTINADLPDPRCTVIKAAQKLRIANNSGKTIKVSIGPYRVDLLNGAGQLFDAPVGDYLLPGVHQVLVEPCCSPALWLK